jgi:hypothetical protein
MPANSHNPFSSDFLRGNADDRLRPPGTRSYVAGATDDPTLANYCIFDLRVVVSSASGQDRWAYADLRMQLRAIELPIQPDPYPHHFHLADVVFFKGLKTERAPRFLDVRTRDWTYLRESFIHISTPLPA